MKFGLENDQIAEIIKILSSNSRIEQVIIFGSRAKGNYRPGSDVDLAVVGGQLKFDELLEISIELGSLNYPMKFDLILYHQIKDDEVIDHIRRVGILFYEKRGLIKSGLPILVESTTRILILGTFPSDQSLIRKEYYANPQNQFWNLLLETYQQPDCYEYGDRVKVLKENFTGLWDVLKSCSRSGSSDNKITNAVTNDFYTLAAKYPNLSYLVFNGKGPYQYFRKHNRNSPVSIKITVLPSSSSANTWKSFSMKLKEWSLLPSFK